MKPIVWTASKIEHLFCPSGNLRVRQVTEATHVLDYHRLTQLWQRYRGSHTVKQTYPVFEWSRTNMLALALGDTHEGVTLLAVLYARGHARRIVLSAPKPDMPIQWHRYDDRKRSYRIELEEVEGYYEIPFPVEHGAEENQWFCARAIAVRIVMSRSNMPAQLAPISRYRVNVGLRRRELADAGRLYFSLWGFLFPLTTPLDDIRLRWSRLVAKDRKVRSTETECDREYFSPSHKQVDQIVDESVHVRPPMMLGTISGVMKGEDPCPIIETIYEFGSRVPFRKPDEPRCHSYAGLLKEPSERFGVLRGTCNAHGGWRIYAREQVDPIYEQTPTPIPTIGKEYTIALCHVLATNDPKQHYRIYPNPFTACNRWLGREIGDESGSFRFMHDLFGCVILRDSPVVRCGYPIEHALFRELPKTNEYFGSRILIVWSRALPGRGGIHRER